MLLHSSPHYNILVRLVTFTVAILANDKSIVVATEFAAYDENASFVSLSENAVCSDMFDVNQCLFIEKAMRVVISNFEQKRKKDKINYDEQIQQFEEKLLKLRTQNREMSHQISQLEKLTSKLLVKENFDQNKHQSTMSEQSSPFTNNPIDDYNRHYTGKENWRHNEYLKENYLLNLTYVSFLLQYILLQ